MDTEAWLLHRYFLKSRSVQLILFTPEHGRLEGFYRQGYSLKQSAIALFMPLWCTYSHRKDYCYIQKIEPQDSGLCFKNLSLVSALYLNELLVYTLQPHDAYPDLYVQYTNALKNLSACSDRMMLEVFLRTFEWHLLAAHGNALAASYIDPKDYYEFEAANGFINVNHGIIGADVLRIIAGDFTSDPLFLKNAKHIMRKAIAYLIGNKTLQSRRLFLEGM